MQNYVFDLYGTLIDVKTDEQAPRTWKKWLKYLDEQRIKHPPYYRFRKEFFAMDKRNRILLKEETGCNVPEIDIIPVYRELLENYGNKLLSDEKLDEISYMFRVCSREYIRLFPGVLEYLRKLKADGKKTYILSNAQRSYTWPEIVMFGLDKETDDQLISSDFGVMKPDVAFFKALMDKHHLAKEKTLMHGDSMWSDIEGAKNAGISYVHLIDENHPQYYYLNQIKNTSK